MLTQQIVRQGHSVTWWASTFNHFKRRHEAIRSKTIRDGNVEIRLMHGPGYGSSRSLRRIYHHVVTARAFERESAQCGSHPDVIYCSIPAVDLAATAVRVGNRLGAPVVLDVRDLWPDHALTLIPRWLRGAARLVLAREYGHLKRALRSADAVVAISESYLRWGLAQAGRPRGAADAVFPMSYPDVDWAARDSTMVRETRRRHGATASTLLVCFVGSLVDSFDFETIIAASRLLEQARPGEFQVVLAGDGPLRGRLSADVAGLPIALPGWLGRRQLSALLVAADVAIAPYWANATMSLPNKPFEYLASGTPIVESLGGELQELLKSGSAGIHYTPGDPSSLVDALSKLHDAPSMRRSMGENARSMFHEKFRQEIVYGDLVRHLERVAAATLR